MNLAEREYFVYRIRSGLYLLEYEGKEVEVRSPTVEDNYRANNLYQKTYHDCLSANIMTFDQMVDWMYSKDLWTPQKEQMLIDLEQNLDTIKLDMFEKRHDEKIVQQGKKYLRFTEGKIRNLHAEKNTYLNNTCEGISSNEKAMYLFSRCCYMDDQRMDFTVDDNSTILYYDWIKELLTHTQIRELARTDPWRSTWSVKDVEKVFTLKEDRELSVDQRNLILWSQMYDSIKESPECPDEEVVNDDDLLDGWFAKQRKERKEKEAQKAVDDRLSNPNISGKQEVFVMARSDKDAINIHNVNDPAGKMIKRQRQQVINAKGSAVDLDFKDRKAELGAIAVQQRKGRR